MSSPVQPPVDARRGTAGRLTGRSGPQIGPIAITPFRVVLGLFFVGSVAYIAWAIFNVDDSAQIPMVTTGTGVLGLAFAATSAGGAVRMWQSWKLGLQAQTVGWAVFGGIAGMLALGCFAGALVLSLVWGG